MTEQPIKRNRNKDPQIECTFNAETYENDIQNFHLRSAQAQLASLHNWGIAQETCPKNKFMRKKP